MNYVMHFCRNKKCNNGWLDKDLTNVKTFPPDWKYCRECCEKLGIDYDAQTPTSNLTEKELTHRQKIIEKAKKASQARWETLNMLPQQRGNFKRLPFGRYKLSF